MPIGLDQQWFQSTSMIHTNFLKKPYHTGEDAHEFNSEKFTGRGRRLLHSARWNAQVGTCRIIVYATSCGRLCNLVPCVVVRTVSRGAKFAEEIEWNTRGALSVQYRWNWCAALYSCARFVCQRSATLQFVPLLKIADEHLCSPEHFQTVVRESFFFGSSKYLKACWSNLRLLQQNVFAVLPARYRVEKKSPDDVLESVHSQYVLNRTDSVFQISWITLVLFHKLPGFVITFQQRTM